MSDKPQTAIHEAGHAIAMHLTGKAHIYEFVVEREAPLPDWQGEVRATWNEQLTVEEQIRIAYAGPCAELKYLANLGTDVLWDFDLEDVANSFLHPEATADGIVRVRFRTAAGQLKTIEHDH